MCVFVGYSGQTSVQGWKKVQHGRKKTPGAEGEGEAE